MRDLPAVDALLNEIGYDGLPRIVAVDAMRTAIELARHAISSGEVADPAQTARELIGALALSRTRQVINATGVLLHTNLGRSPLSRRAVDEMSVAAGYTNLEVDLETGARGGRGTYIAALLASLTGAEDALVVNNNASAVLLALAATSSGMSVPVGRGELIEIGGAYRLPEVMRASTASLVEVGTTNRTRADDYKTATQVHRCGAILKVHPSNYRIEGFAEEAGIADLAEIARRRAIPLIYDIGSGHLDGNGAWLTDADRTWIGEEPDAASALRSGADLVTFSGDKLLGGPQAGILTGNANLIGLLRQHPLARAMRVDGLTEAALAATLESFATGDVNDIPFWAMARATKASLAKRASELQGEIGGSLVDGSSLIGAGSAPGSAIATPHLTVDAPDSSYTDLLRGVPSVAARRREGRLVLDLRTVSPDQDHELANAIKRCL